MARWGTILLALACLAPTAPAGAQPLPCTAALVATVEEMVDSLLALGLPASEAARLEAEARVAIAAAEERDLPAALRRLRTQENRIRALVRTGQLDAASGDALLALIEQFRGALANCTGVPALAAFNCRSGTSENELLWLSAPVTHVATRILYRTDRYPTGPDDAGATVLGSFPGSPGTVGRARHAPLLDGRRYFYAAFGDDGSGELSPGRLSFGRPQPDGDGFGWSYTAGGTARPAVGGLPDLFTTVSGAGFEFGLEVGANGGRWVHPPARLRAPAPARPVTIPPPAVPFDTPLVLVTSLQGRVWALDAATGLPRWVSPVLGELRAPVCGMFRAFGGADDVLLIGTADRTGRNRILGLRPADGSLAWSFDDADGDGIGAIEESCAVDYARQQVYFTSRPVAAGTDTVWALSVATGSATKTWSVGVPGAGTAPVVNAGAIYLGTTAGEVHAIDADDGAPLWGAPYATGDGPVNGFVFPQRGTGRLAFSTARRTHLIHDDGTAASPVWTSPVDLRDPNVPLILDDEVLVADADGRVLSLDATQPDPAVVVFARFGDGARPAAPGLPFFDARSGLYLVGTTEGVLYAVQRR